MPLRSMLDWLIDAVLNALSNWQVTHSVGMAMVHSRIDGN